MRKFVAGLIAAGALWAAGGVAYGAPADEGNCISDRDNGGAAGGRISAVAGPGFGGAVADGIGGGVIGDAASDPACGR